MICEGLGAFTKAPGLGLFLGSFTERGAMFGDRFARLPTGCRGVDRFPCVGLPFLALLVDARADLLLGGAVPRCLRGLLNVGHLLLLRSLFRRVGAGLHHPPGTGCLVARR